MDFDPTNPPDPPDPVMHPTATKRRIETDVQPPAKKSIISPDLASASIETVYVDPSMVVGGLSYSPSDKGPFVVHVSRTESDLSAGTMIRPIKFGQFLKTHMINNICTDGIKRVGRNKISVEFTSASDANKFISSPVLSVSKYVATIPTFNITRMGLIRGVPTEMSMTEFVSSLELPNGCGKVLKARRFSRKSVDEGGKVTWIPTQTVVVTFSGQMLPNRVFLFYTSLPVELYLFPTIQCFTCCRFGHTKMQCRSKPRCFRCSKEHAGDNCNVSEKDSTCLHCSGRHFATNKVCPELERQKSIKSVMARNSISYEEAASQFPKVSRLYAEITQSSISSSSSSSNLTCVPASSSQAINNRTYSKTVSQSRPKTPFIKSFDQTAHHKIVATPTSMLPNGCALNNNQTSGSSPQQENMIETLLSLVINIIMMSSQPLPSNVAHKLTQLVSMSGQYGSLDHVTMEHSEYATQET